MVRFTFRNTLLNVEDRLVLARKVRCETRFFMLSNLRQLYHKTILWKWKRRNTFKIQLRERIDSAGRSFVWKGGLEVQDDVQVEVWASWVDDHTARWE